MTRQHIPLSPVTLTITGEQAYVRSARIGRNLGAFSVMLFLIALAFHSFGAADTPSFLLAFALALGLGTIAMLFSARAFNIVWVQGKRGMADSSLGLCYGSFLWLIPVTIFVLSLGYPQATDVTTQGDMTPDFLIVEGVRPEWAKSVDLDLVTPEPLSRPLVTDAPLAEVYDLVLDLIESMHWEIITESAPEEKKPTFAAIQASAATLFGFTDDVVIQLTLEDKHTRIDMRSSSRTGPFDLGRNAKRIDDFLLALRQKLNER